MIMTTEPKTQEFRKVENPVRLRNKVCAKHYVDTECEYYGDCSLRVLKGRYVRHRGSYLVCLEDGEDAVVVYKVSDDDEILEENKLYLYKAKDGELYVAEFNATDLVEAIEQSRIAIKYARREHVEEWLKPILEKVEAKHMVLTLDDILF